MELSHLLCNVLPLEVTGELALSCKHYLQATFYLKPLVLHTLSLSLIRGGPFTLTMLLYSKCCVRVSVKSF